uniref:Expressed conserved protein n=1 Tax=Echinococcus granulosus TaxID=6210 RepID=U6FTE7_ECHGR|nr:hypothetical protein EgrG_002068200 [Echinococcus granulosus]
MGLASKLRKLKFLFSKSRCTKESACDAKSKEVNLNNMIAFDAILPLKPVAFEKKWRGVMNSYHKQGGEEVYDFYDDEIVAGLLKFCGTCGLTEIDESGWMEEKGCYTYEYHPLSRAERRRKRVELENYIMEEVLETELLIKSYVKGEIG